MVPNRRSQKIRWIDARRCINLPCFRLLQMIITNVFCTPEICPSRLAHEVDFLSIEKLFSAHNDFLSLNLKINRSRCFKNTQHF